MGVRVNKCATCLATCNLGHGARLFGAYPQRAPGNCAWCQACDSHRAAQGIGKEGGGVFGGGSAE